MDTWIGVLAFNDTDLASMLQNGIIVHFLDGHINRFTDFHDTDFAVIVQNGIIVHFQTLDGHMDWCTS